MKRHTGRKPKPRTQSGELIIFSRIASFVFHPFFMTTIAALGIYKLVPLGFQAYSSDAIKIFMVRLALLTSLLPFLSVLLFRKLGLISDAKMHEAGDRIYPLLTALIFYTLGYWFLAPGLPLFIHSLLLGSCFSIFLLFIVTNFLQDKCAYNGSGNFAGCLHCAYGK